MVDVGSIFNATCAGVDGVEVDGPAWGIIEPSGLVPVVAPVTLFSSSTTSNNKHQQHDYDSVNTSCYARLYIMLIMRKWDRSNVDYLLDTPSTISALCFAANAIAWDRLIGRHILINSICRDNSWIR